MNTISPHKILQTLALGKISKMFLIAEIKKHSRVNQILIVINTVTVTFKARRNFVVLRTSLLNKLNYCFGSLCFNFFYVDPLNFKKFRLHLFSNDSVLILLNRNLKNIFPLNIEGGVLNWDFKRFF